MKLIVLRHGETQGNLKHCYIGRTDESLCEKGHQTLKKMKKQLDGITCDMLFVSPMKRCIESAEILFPGQKQYVIEDFIETDFGLFEGKNYEQLNDDMSYQKWIDSQGMMPFPNGESRQAVKKRIESGMLQLIHIVSQSEISANALIVMVVHGGTIMTLLEMYGKPQKDYYEYQCKNGEGYLLEMILEPDIVLKPLKELAKA